MNCELFFPGVHSSAQRCDAGTFSGLWTDSNHTFRTSTRTQFSLCCSQEVHHLKMAELTYEIIYQGWHTLMHTLARLKRLEHSPGNEVRRCHCRQPHLDFRDLRLLFKKKISEMQSLCDLISSEWVAFPWRRCQEQIRAVRIYTEDEEEKCDPDCRRTGSRADSSVAHWSTKLQLSPNISTLNVQSDICCLRFLHSWAFPS